MLLYWRIDYRHRVRGAAGRIRAGCRFRTVKKQVVWKKHAEERQQQWQQRLGITREEVEQVLTAAQQIVAENDVWVAQSRRGNGLLRIMFAEIGNTQRILTLYWTNQVKRYWQEEFDER